MSSTYEDAMYDMYMEEEARIEHESEIINKAIEGLSAENISFYLGTYGDAIEKRIKKCLDEANILLKINILGWH
jgi:hypothetical protein